MKLFAERVRARLRSPLEAAWGSVSERELVLVRLVDRFGNEGFGEAAPLPGYGGANLDEVCAALAGWSGGQLDELQVPEARSAVDLALCDLRARRLGVPVWKLLGAPTAPEVEVNATVTSPEEASAAAQAGFSCVKVKVGLGDDRERLAAVREAAGPEMAIRVDANGAWSVEGAVHALRELSSLGIELCEEPVHGLEAISEVAGSLELPVALDESAALPGALDRRRCDAVCLKLARCGGIAGLVAAAGRARAVGYRLYLASTLDGPLGIAAALHTAAVVQPDTACGLATLSWFDRTGDFLMPRDGLMKVPSGPGLGDGLLEWYR